MLSEEAKITVICVVISGFAVVIAFLLCLLCPCCPLQRMVDKCARRGSNKKQPDPKDKNWLTNCCEEKVATNPSNPDGHFNYGGVQGETQQQSSSVTFPKAWEQKRFEAESKPQVTLTFSVTRQSDCLVVYLFKAEGTPGPRMGLCHNNFALVQLNQGSRSAALADVRTRIVCQTTSPVFNETLILSVPADVPAEQLSLGIQCLDFDRFSQERVVGEVRVPLPLELEQTVQYNSVMSEPPLVEKGEILVALHYMPTAERLSVILLKASNVLTPERRVPAPYLHVVLLVNGSTAFKKRTRIFEESSRPVFNESVSIGLPLRSLDRVTLLVSLMNCHLRRRVRPDLDSCLGYAIFSSVCYGSGRAHWTEMLSRPRTPLAYWHKLC